MRKTRMVQLGICIAAFALITGSLWMGNPAYAITNGEPDGNRHPYVGIIVFDIAPGQPAWRCTGTLISPTVVLCAGHCTEGAVAARVWFDEVVEGNPDYPFGGPSAVEAKEIHTHPDFGMGGPGLPDFVTHDVGVIILKTPVYMTEYGKLPKAGLVDELAMKTDVDLVGYGVQDMHRGGGQPYWKGLKNRFYAQAKLIASNHVLSDEFLRLTANPAQGKGGTSFGDSGGPVLLKGKNVILGVNSFVTSYECAGVTYSNRVDTADVLEWIMSFL